MKRLAIITTSLLAALTVFGGTTAYAARSETVYPEDGQFVKNLTFENLVDYAVNDAQYAFAEGRNVHVYEEGEITVYKFSENVAALGCAEKTFYCATESGSVYSLPYKAGQQTASYTMTEPLSNITVGDFNYFLKESVLKVSDYSNDVIITAEGAYSKLKMFGESVYAIKDSLVYTLNGTQQEELLLPFVDYSATVNISVGQAADSLKTYSAPSVVKVKEGAYMTEVDLSSTDEEYFKTGKTILAEKITDALLLCKTGNAAIIAIEDKSYILLETNISETTSELYSKPEYEYAKITTGNAIYAVPYIANSAIVKQNAAGTVVRITNKVVSDDVLETTFCEIEYTLPDGTVSKGYVAEQFLTKTEFVIEDNKDPVKVEDPDYSEETNTKTMLLIFAVVILVLAAVGYLAYTATSDKHRKGKKQKEQPKEDK